MRNRMSKPCHAVCPVHRIAVCMHNPHSTVENKAVWLGVRTGDLNITEAVLFCLSVYTDFSLQPLNPH